MTDATRRAAITDLYSYGGLPDDATQLLSRSLQPRSDDLLLEAAGEAGARSGALVVDAGCREASSAIELVRRYGCRVLGLDLVKTWLPMAVRDVEQAGLSDRIGFGQADLEALPVADGSVDVVWCRDVLACLAEPAPALAECARVLRPGGGMVLYVPFTTPRLAAHERELLFAGGTASPLSMDQPTVEAAIADAGLVIAGCDEIGSEWSEHHLEQDATYFTDSLLEVARLTRNRAFFEERFGELWYVHCLRFALWGPWILLGKLLPVLYVLRKPD